MALDPIILLVWLLAMIAAGGVVLRHILGRNWTKVGAAVLGIGVSYAIPAAIGFPGAFVPISASILFAAILIVGMRGWDPTRLRAQFASAAIAVAGIMPITYAFLEASASSVIQGFAFLSLLAYPLWCAAGGIALVNLLVRRTS